MIIAIVIVIAIGIILAACRGRAESAGRPLVGFANNNNNNDNNNNSNNDTYNNDNDNNNNNSSTSNRNNTNHNNNNNTCYVAACLPAWLAAGCTAARLPLLGSLAR